MNPKQIDRTRVKHLTDLPNVGPATAADLQRLGFDAPAQLVGACPLTLYERLCALAGERIDPCVLDVFLSITRYLDGEPPQPWWAYTETRKRLLAARQETGDAVVGAPGDLRWYEVAVEVDAAGHAPPQYAQATVTAAVCSVSAAAAIAALKEDLAQSGYRIVRGHERAVEASAPAGARAAAPGEIVQQGFYPHA